MMADITLASDEINLRGNQIVELLKPISPHVTGPVCMSRSEYGKVIYGTYDGSRPVSLYRDWRFATKVKDCRGMYFEIWEPFNDYKEWRLFRAYFSLFIWNRWKHKEVEVLCLHCDPSEPESHPHAYYKQGPHLHLVRAKYPLQDAHIGLNMGNLTQVLSSIESLSSAIGLGLKMVEEEVLGTMTEPWAEDEIDQ